MLFKQTGQEKRIAEVKQLSSGQRLVVNTIYTECLVRTGAVPKSSICSLGRENNRVGTRISFFNVNRISQRLIVLTELVQCNFSQRVIPYASDKLDFYSQFVEG